MDANEAERLVSYQQFRREFVDVSRVTLIRWRKEEGFPAPVVLGGRNYFKVTDIKNWLAERATPKAA